MDPLDFYKFAKEVKGYSSNFPEALKRTIVGRIYYAIFLMIRDDLEVSLKHSGAGPMYKSLSQKGLIHSLISAVLRKVERTNHLGNLLYGMRRRRGTADYKLKGSKNWDKEIGEITLQAEELLRNQSKMQTLFSQKSIEIDTLIFDFHSKL